MFPKVVRVDNNTDIVEFVNILDLSLYTINNTPIATKTPTKGKRKEHNTDTSLPGVITPNSILHPNVSRTGMSFMVSESSMDDYLSRNKTLSTSIQEIVEGTLIGTQNLSSTIPTEKTRQLKVGDVVLVKDLKNIFHSQYSRRHIAMVESLRDTSIDGVARSVVVVYKAQIDNDGVSHRTIRMTRRVDELIYLFTPDEMKEDIEFEKSRITHIRTPGVIKQYDDDVDKITDGRNLNDYYLFLFS